MQRLRTRLSRQRLAYRHPHVCNDLLPYSRFFDQLRHHRQTNLGVQAVPVERIVGSFSRSHEFDPSFRPRHRRTRETLGVPAGVGPTPRHPPPVVLYKVGDAYFVEDGNHRIARARRRRTGTIRALVVEADVSTLMPSASCSRLGFRLERQR